MTKKITDRYAVMGNPFLRVKVTRKYFMRSIHSSFKM